MTCSSLRVDKLVILTVLSVDKETTRLSPKVKLFSIGFECPVTTLPLEMSYSPSKCHNFMIF